MGRFVPLASPLALILHLLLAIVYGGLLSIAIGRARGAWVFTAAVVGSLMLYAGNWWLLRASEIPVTAGESRALAAHFLFGFAFTIFFKMDEADAGERAVDHARAR